MTDKEPDNLPARIVANPNLVNLTMEQMQRFARGYAEAGLFKGKNFNPATLFEIFVQISAGQAIGLDPFTAVTQIHIIEGKPEMSTNLQLALAKASGKYDYRVKWGEIEELGYDREELPELIKHVSPGYCTITVFSANGGDLIGETTFSIIDSYRAGLTAPSKNGKPSNHIKYPRNMLFNRAGSNAIAFFMPDATMLRAYSPGEIGGEENELEEPKVAALEAEHEAVAEEIEDAEIVHPAEEEPAADLAAVQREARAREEFAASEEAQQSGGDRETLHAQVERETAEEERAMAAVFDPPVTPDPTVENSEHEPVITSGRKNLLWVLVKRAQLTDERRHEITREITGQEHLDRIPERHFQAMLDRLNAEIALVEDPGPEEE